VDLEGSGKAFRQLFSELWSQDPQDLSRMINVKNLLEIKGNNKDLFLISLLLLLLYSSLSLCINFASSVCYCLVKSFFIC